MPCDSGWIKRSDYGRAGLADDYVLQLRRHDERGRPVRHEQGRPSGRPSSRGAGRKARRGEGRAAAIDLVDEVECHLAMGGKTCMLPTVLPAWSRPPFLGGAPPERATAARLNATFSSLAEPAARGAGGGRAAPRCPADGAGWRLRLQLDALRAAASAAATEPMLEASSHFDSTSLPGGGGGIAGAASSVFQCHEPAELTAALREDELERLKALRAACPGFFAARGSRRGQLEWLHRKRAL